MDHNLKKTSEYLSKFFLSRISQYREDLKEYRPQSGYGNYYKNNDVTQSMWNIVLTIEEDLLDMRIPETYSSPKHLIDTILNFHALLTKNNTLYVEVYDKYKDTEPPSPLHVAYRMNNEVLNAIEYTLTFEENMPFLRNINESIPSAVGISEIVRLIDNFGNVSRKLLNRRKEKGESRDTIIIKDEYDVQDLLSGLLCIYFSDVRPEEWNPSYAGSSTRVDFLLKNEKIVIEVKMTREKLKDKEIGEQLIIDIANYRTHPDCRTLICFIYDPKHLLLNPTGIISDLEKSSSKDLNVIVRVGY